MGLLAGIASFFVAGLGQAIKGEVGRGIKIFLITVILGAATGFLAASPVPVLAIVTQTMVAIVWFLQLLDAGGLFEMPFV